MPPTPVIDIEVARTPLPGIPLAVVAAPAPPDPDTASPASPPAGTELPGDAPDRPATAPAGPTADGGAEDEPQLPELGPHAELLGVGAEWLEAAGVTGRAGSVHPVPPGAAVAGGRADGAEAVGGEPVGVVGSGGWVVGIGGGGERDLRRAGTALLRAAHDRAETDRVAGRPVADTLQVALPAGLDERELAAFVTGAALGGYTLRVTGEDRPTRVRTMTLLTPDTTATVTGADSAAGTTGTDGATGVAEVVRRAWVLARATALTRDLGNMPSGTKDPAWLAATAADVAATVPGLDVRVRDEDWLREHGFGGMLAVGGGSARGPRLIELSWQPPSAGAGSGRHVVLVGKGITFDTGGLSIKPAAGLHIMKTDMAGGAAVIAAMVVIAELGLPVRVTGLVAAAENHVSGSAYRPGDVLRHVDGRTTYITDADGEGRLVLADAIGYAVRTLRPDLLVDVATLTGAMRISLGVRTGGFFATDDELAAELVAAGERVGEAWWRLPLGFDVVDVATGHADQVRSEWADVEQCPPGPGAISAALFLREFTGGTRWAHLDIAGAARSDTTVDELVPGATGFAARTLVELAGTEAGRPP